MRDFYGFVIAFSIFVCAGVLVATHERLKGIEASLETLAEKFAPDLDQG
jgi:hypothetical protein